MAPPGAQRRPLGGVGGARGALTSAWIMFQAFLSPTLFSVLYSSRPSFRSFLALSFTCQVEATDRRAGTTTQPAQVSEDHWPLLLPTGPVALRGRHWPHPPATRPPAAPSPSSPGNQQGAA